MNNDMFRKQKDNTDIKMCEVTYKQGNRIV